MHNWKHEHWLKEQPHPLWQASAKPHTQAALAHEMTTPPRPCQVDPIQAMHLPGFALD